MPRLANNQKSTYCLGCGAKYKKRKYLWWPIKARLYKTWSIGTHGYQVGYSKGLVSTFARVVRVGWLRIVLGYQKDKKHRGIDCRYDQKNDAVLHPDLYAWEKVYETALDDIFEEAFKRGE